MRAGVFQSLMRAVLAASLLAIIACPAPAQTPGVPPAPAPSSAEAAPPPGPPAELASPRAAAQNFWESYVAWRDAAEPDKPAALEQAAAFIRVPDLTERSRLPVIVQDLGEIIDGPLNAWGLPDWRGNRREPTFIGIAREPVGSIADFPLPHLAAVAPDERVQLRRDEAGAWKFSSQTVEQLSVMHEAVFPDVGVPGFLRRHGFAVLVDNRLFGVAYWRWAGLFLAILVAVCIDFFFRALTAGVSRRFIKKKEDDQHAADARDMILRVARSVGLFASANFVFFTVPVLELPPTAEGIIQVATRTIATVAAVWGAFRVVDLIGEFLARRAAKTSSKIDDLLIPLVRKTAKIFVVAVGVVYIANALSIEIVPLLTGLGIGGLAVAFAAKDTIENFFGSIAVIADRPFEVGDWVNIDGIDGTVEQLGLRSTRIRTFYNSLVTVPNSMLVRATVDNYGRRLYRRYKTTLNLTYDTSPDRMESFCEGIRELVRQHPYTRKDYLLVYVNDFGPHSIDILVYIFFRVPDWTTELRERHRLILDIMRLAQTIGVEFAFPTQTLHMFNETGTPTGVPEELTRGDEEGLRESGAAAAERVIADAEFKHQRPTPARAT
ncbi:MAG: mechanosensitive ion channel family protein [Planctomycetota bacterium]